MYQAIRSQHSAISEAYQRISRPIFSPGDCIPKNVDGPRIPELNVIPGPVSSLLGERVQRGCVAYNK